MNLWIQIAYLLATYATLWFILSLILKRNDIADIAWGLGFILVAWFSYRFGNQGDRALLVNMLTTLWGLRLASHIYLRNKGKSEDFRYKKWREDWGNAFYIRSYLQVYLLQMAFLYLISIATIYINTQKNVNLSWIDLIAIAIWMTGFYFESMGDYQLEKFKKNPSNKAKIMKTGVWKYTRHPNYFGEVIQWWGIYLLALPLMGGWTTIISPLTITFLILGLSGIPMLERKYKGNVEYEKYQQETNAFFPWFPKT